jgi:hypothetical protein
LLVLAVALIARLPGLGNPLAYDEILVLVKSVRLPLDQLLASYLDSTYHALYAVLANLAIMVFGETPFVLRLPALVFGLLAICSTMFFVRLVGSRREAFVVGMLLALSYHAVWFSQYARGYTGLMFFMMAASALFYTGWKGQHWAWPWYALTVGLGSYQHLFMTMAAVSHAAILVLDALPGRRLWAPAAVGARRAAWLALGGACALTVLLYTAAIPRMIEHFSGVGPGGDSAADPTGFLRAGIASMAVNPTSALAALTLAAPVLVGLIAYARRERLAMIVLVLPGILGVLATVLILRGVAPQFFVCLLPIALILAVRGIEATAGRWRTLILGAAVVGSLVTLLPVYHYPKQDFPGAMAYVRERAARNASVAGFGVAGTAYNLYYSPGIECIYSQEEYDSLLGRRPEAWVLMTSRHDAQTRLGDIYRRLQNDFRLVATFPGTLDDGDLLVYYRRPDRRIRTASRTDRPPIIGHAAESAFRGR